MTKIATLGPANTFSELAARKYVSHNNIKNAKIELYPSFNKVFEEIKNENDCAIVPIENIAEGYVAVVLDLLIKNNLYITGELLQPINFSLVANCNSISLISKIYTQFVTKGQCEQFLETLNDNVAIITTQSNGTSLEEVKKGIENESAIVPSFSVTQKDFPLVIEDIADYNNNQTRFISVSKNPISFIKNTKFKTSLLIYESLDRPGMLSDILHAFAKRQINLVSIMSRPTKTELGKYHFFIDVEGYYKEDKLQEALIELSKENTIRVLGSYPIARNLIK